MELTEQEVIRRSKLEELKAKGIDPFGQRYDRTHNSKQIKDLFNELTREELEQKNATVKIAGRIMTKRGQGKAGFMTLQDREGKIQAYVRLDHVQEKQFDIYNKADIGDIVGIEGIVFKTQKGELTVKASSFHHLTKALRPLPDKFHGLQDIEMRARRRYVDLIVNEQSFDTVLKRSKIIKVMREYWDNQGFIEVETPVLQSTLGGAAARPFMTHHNALDMPFNLRIALELPLKRLIVGGLESVYEIGRVFRNEGVDRTHNPEFTMFEAYQAYGDMETMMSLTENCFEYIAMKILKTTKVEFDNKIIDVKAPWKKAHMVDLINEYTGVNFFEITDYEQAKQIAKKHNVHVEPHHTGIGHIINSFFETFVEDKIIQPTFVYGHPVEISFLAKKSEKDPRFTDRFEVFINCKEYANAYSELNDPIDQKERFESQLNEKSLGNDEAVDMDSDYIEALEYGMPPTGGLGIGVDRMIMLFTNQSSIREVIAFPHMRSKGQ